MKNFIMILMVLGFGGCALKSSPEVANYKVIKAFEDENITSDKFWYKAYNEIYLNELVELALANNYDLANAALNLKKAYINAGLMGVDFYPTPSASLSGSKSRDIGTGDEFKKSFSSGFNLSYELDLFGKIYANYESAKWTSKASEFDLENTKLTLINSLVQAYFHALYLNEALELYNQNLSNYLELKRITKAKFDLGKGEYSDVVNMEQSLLDMRSQILSIQQEITTNNELLRNLIAEKPGYNFKFAKLKITTVKFQGVDLNVPYYTLGNRPDIRALASNLNSAYFNYQEAFRSFFPSVSIGASLRDSDNQLSKSFGFNMFNGTISINLPFLDYARVEKRINLSDLNFQSDLNRYQSALISALNEVDTQYKLHKISMREYEISKQNLAKQQELEKIYQVKYEYGRSEFKDYLNAKNSVIRTKISLLRQKYDILSSEIGIYKAMAGKFIR